MSAPHFLDLDDEGADTTAMYAALNVPRSASTEEIVKAYRKMALVRWP
jgi:DnaJ-class molecular chaperone